MNTFLLATDGSEHAGHAEEFTIETLSPDTDKIIVAVVVEEVPNFMFGEGFDPASIEIELSKAAENIGDKTAGQLEEAGFTTEVIVVEGDPGEKLCSLAEEHEVEGIVMGRRGRGRVGEILLGSISHYVIHHASVPVMVVPQTDEQ